MDHLVHILIEKVVDYYATRGRRQVNDFDGPSLYFQKRLKVIKQSRTISIDSVMVQYSSLDIFALRTKNMYQLLGD